MLQPEIKKNQARQMKEIKRHKVKEGRQSCDPAKEDHKTVFIWPLRYHPNKKKTKVNYGMANPKYVNVRDVLALLWKWFLLFEVIPNDSLDWKASLIIRILPPTHSMSYGHKPGMWANIFLFDDPISSQIIIWNWEQTLIPNVQTFCVGR